jgi:hypothetical protein
MTINDIFQNLTHLREISKGNSITFTLMVDYWYNDGCSNDYEPVDTLAELNGELTWLKDVDEDAATHIFGEKSALDGTECIVDVVSYGYYNNPEDNVIIYKVSDYLSLNLYIDQD